MASKSDSSFKKAEHTFIVSDIHMADAEPPHIGNPLWKRYKRPKYFVDRSFRRFLDQVQSKAKGSIELILNGDIFDFDSVMVLPKKRRFPIRLLERLRGLSAEEPKSRFKMEVILKDHYVWVEALRDFILAGNRVVFIIGNHDVELHWPSVQQTVVDALKLPEKFQDHVRFCEWYYISNEDTLIEHGNQYDDYCICSNPIHPTIKKRGRISIRLPFGNLAGKFMMNGIGLMNPHVESTFIMPVRKYLVFFFKYLIRTQPFILWTWFWSACVTAVYSLSEGLLPSLRDPMTVESRVEKIAAKANSDAKTVRALRALHVHPAIFNPLKILRELWLDRALLLGLTFGGTFFLFSIVNVVTEVSFWWWLLSFLIVLPFFVFYARSVDSDVNKVHRAMMSFAPLSARIAGVERIVHGHSHRGAHQELSGVEYLNTGTWSPAYRDVECTQPYGEKYFAWIRPKSEGKGREAVLMEWRDPGFELYRPERRAGEKTDEAEAS